ncbi:MAG: TraR/DksA family transcriptional regulator [bacterium]
MRKEELEKFRIALLRERARIMDIIKRRYNDLTEWDSDSQETLSSFLINPMEISDSCYRRELTAKLIERISYTLHQINNALERIEDNSFGICISCGKQISLKRLKAVPYAIYCVECQRSYEKNKAGVN